MSDQRTKSGNERAERRKEEERSVTVSPASMTGTHRGLVPVLIVVGSADGDVAPSAERVLRVGDGFTIGRHAPPNDGEGGGWIVRDKSVSSKHATIACHDRAYVLLDAGSRNGTVVDGKEVKRQARLENGSLIFVGRHAAVFRLVEAAALMDLEREWEAPLGPVATASPVMASACHRMRRAFLNPKSKTKDVLLIGETGVGKEVHARALHAASARPGRFLAINCAAVPHELFESELFGYVRGAHSQAYEDKAGLVEQAEGGTLFLDEIGEIRADLQVKLLRFLQTRETGRLGSTRRRTVDVRIVAATNRPASPDGRRVAGLRDDLTARFGLGPISVPPLRERIEDLMALMQHHRGEPRGPLESAAFQMLCLYAWPANVRELAHVANDMDLAADGGPVRREHVPKTVSHALPLRVAPQAAAESSAPPARQELIALLTRFAGNVSAVAEELGCHRVQVYRWAERYDLDPAGFRRG